MGNSQGTTIPTTMKRIILVEPNKNLESAVLKIEEVPVPQPLSGEVLIRVVAAPGIHHFHSFTSFHSL